ncbi:aggregation-promoting factor C-terminal-like domain-containing protein [Bacillus testis]|uniref:aggregation-promoting factor C-terminal-like domain-containing protein n=1 Tax=Bacillus testis TaxID=1622072 RepID=UPI00067F70E3|nr:transglycosylase SLT domain-containing protein [Bacillus testis]
MAVKAGWGIGFGTSGPKQTYTDKNQEIERTKTVIQNRQNQNMDITAQLQHYKNLTGQDYALPKTPSAVPSYTPLPTTPTDNSAYQLPTNNTAKWDQQAYLKQQLDGVNSIWDQQKEAQLLAYRNSQSQAIGKINQQKAETGTQYQSSRNQADVVNAQNVQRLQEMMAANGLNSSGENVTATAALASARQKSLGDLTLQEQQQMNDYDRQIGDINNPAQEQALIAQLEAQRAQALFEATGRADELGYQRERDAVTDNRYANEWNYNLGRDSISDQRYADDTNYKRSQDAYMNALQEAQVTGKYNGQDTYQAARDKLEDAKWDKTFEYQKGRDNMADNQWRQELLWQKKQFASDDAWRKYTFNNMSATDKANLEWNKKQFGEEMAWKMYETQYNGNIELSKNQAAINGYTNASTGAISTVSNSGGSAAKGTASFNKNMAAAVATGKVNSAWVPILTEIVKRESGFNPTAKNPKSTAYGYGQFLKSTRAQYEKKTGLSYDNPVNQLIMMAQYVKDRYKTPENALAFWNKNHWY